MQIAKLACHLVLLPDSRGTWGASAPRDCIAVACCSWHSKLQPKGVEGGSDALAERSGEQTRGQEKQLHEKDKTQEEAQYTNSWTVQQSHMGTGSSACRSGQAFSRQTERKRTRNKFLFLIGSATSTHTYISTLALLLQPTASGCWLPSTLVFIRQRQQSICCHAVFILYQSKTGARRNRNQCHKTTTAVTSKPQY